MNNIIPIIKHILKIIQHKYFVFKAGLKIECPIWRLIIHDWTKFLPSEFIHYSKHFFGDRSNEYGFSRAWLHHQNCNDHHWEYWISRTSLAKNKEIKCIQMPIEAVREMVADWLGASRAYAGKWPESFESWEWYQKNFCNIPLPSNIKSDVDFILRYHWFRYRRD